MATNTGNTGASRGGRNPTSLLEKVLGAPSGALMVGLMILSGIEIPNEVHDGSPIRLQLMRSVKTPLDDEQRNLITTFVTQWLDTSDPTGARVRNEARNASTVKPVVLKLIQDLSGANTQSTQRATSSAKKAETERRLEQLIGLKPGRPDSDPNPILNSIMGQGAGGGGNDIISAMLVLNELSENTPLPIHIGPRRTAPIEDRRAWAEGFARNVALVAISATVGLAIVAGALTHWSAAIVVVVGMVALFAWLIKQLAKTTGKFFLKTFPQFDKDGFRKKVIKQCETTLAFLLFGTDPVTKEEIVQWGLAPKFLEEVDGELRKEGFVYNRYDEQIDDWVKQYLGLAPATPVATQSGLIDRAVGAFDRLWEAFDKYGF